MAFTFRAGQGDKIQPVKPPAVTFQSSAATPPMYRVQVLTHNENGVVQHPLTTLGGFKV